MGEPEAKLCSKWRLSSAFALCLLGACALHMAEDSIGGLKRIGFRFQTTFRQVIPVFLNTSAALRDRNPILVLYWTELWGRKWPLPDMHRKCSSETASRCEFSNNISLFNSSDVLLFHMRDTLRLPTVRRPSGQKWVFFIQESPVHTFVNLPRLQGLYNLTMSYKRESNLKYPYGSYIPADNTSDYDPQHNYAAVKTKLVAWFAGNCRTQSRRELYVKELGRYIDVHTYGVCGNYSCPRKHKCHAELRRDTYKFYLSFENSLCTDYATEKIWDTLLYPIIPVVLGQANYTAILPPHSFIDVRNFASPKILAEYLLTLHKNDTLYNQYFSWKRDYNIGSHWPYLCDICDYLYNNRAVVEKVDDIKAFWSVETNCVMPNVFYRGLKLNL